MVRLNVFRCLVLAAVPLLAQVDRASLTGSVTDASGAAVAGAKIEIYSESTGFRRSAVSGDDGRYSMPGLPVGEFTLSASKEGFQAKKIDKLALIVGLRRVEDIQLEVGAVASAVTVNADATPLEQTSAEIGTAIGSKQLANIPINGRNWSSLMQFAPGAVNTGDGSQNSIRFYGRGRDENNWTFDGTDATGIKDPRQEANLRLVVPMDAIAEFRVSSANYSADSGTGAGGQVNLVSRTGTNEFRGSAFWFVRNSAFDARRPFDGSQPPPFKLNQYGGNFGGPIIKDRTFFFVNYEGLRQRLQSVRAAALVPSRAFRARAVQTSPAIAPLVNAFPVGNAGLTSNADVERFIGTGSVNQDEDAGMVRFDHRFSDRTSIFARFNIVQGIFNEIRNDLLEPRISDVRPSQGTIQLSHVFSPSIINETRFGYNRSPLERTAQGVATESIRVGGLSSTQAQFTNIEKPTTFSILNATSLLKGRHALKFGGELRRVRMNVGETTDTVLRYANLAAFERNQLDRFDVGTGLPTQGVRRWYGILYAQDDFRVSSTLTLNLGVRWEYYTVSNEVNGRGNVFDVTRCAGFCPPGTEWFFPDRNNVAPRIGLAWSPKMFNNRTVFRAGYGMFFGPGQNDDVTAAVDSIEETLQLQARDVPGLRYPIAPFLPQARNQGITPRSVQRDREDFYSQQWSFSIQQQLPMAFVATFGYVGQKGTNLFNRSFVNLPSLATGQRPLPAFGIVDEKQNYGRSNFNGGQFSLTRQFTSGWLFQGNYLYGVAIDDTAGAGDGSEVMIASCRVCDKAFSDNDIRHSANFNTVYELPFGRGKAYGWKDGFGGGLASGWSLSGIYSFRTGRPVNVVLNRASGDVPDGNTVRQRPNVLDFAAATPAVQSTGLWLNRAAFATPARGAWGNLGRNAFRGPGLWQVDIGVQKRTAITERMNLEFRAELFNLFNRAQYGNPENNISNATFGQILSLANASPTGQGSARSLQLMVRVNF
jgi:hypothetical protein